MARREELGRVVGDRRAHGVHLRAEPRARHPQVGPGQRLEAVARATARDASTAADSSSRMRSSSRCSARVASVQALFSSTTVSGSTKSVAPEALWSWTIPLTRPLASARIGMT